MKKHTVLPLLLALLFVFSASSAETLSSSLYDPGAATDHSPLYEHEIFYDKVGNLFTVPVLFGQDLKDP